MIFGKTIEQVKQKNSDEAKKLIFGIKKYAFKPVHLTDGRTVFLRHYYEYQDGSYKHGEYRLSANNRKHLEPSMNNVFLFINYSRVDNHEELAKMMNEA